MKSNKECHVGRRAERGLFKRWRLSSLTEIGSRSGGGCGPGGNGYDGSNSFLNPTGKSIYWNPALATGIDGIASVQIKLPKGTWRIFVYSADQSVDFGSSYIDVTAKWAKGVEHSSSSSFPTEEDWDLLVLPPLGPLRTLIFFQTRTTSQHSN